MKKKRYKIYANALLSDNKILFWYTGHCQMDEYSWYKDFYYAGINYFEYSESHVLTCVSQEFEATEKTNNDIFEFEAPEWYSQWEISDDSKGEPPYRRLEDL